MSEYEFWIYKDQTGFAFSPSFLSVILTCRLLLSPLALSPRCH